MWQLFSGAEISGIVADVAIAEGAASFIAQASEADILINEVGTARHKPFEDNTDADWLELFEFNVMSGIRITRGYLPGMVTRASGSVVFISSESA